MAIDSKEPITAWAEQYKKTWQGKALLYLVDLLHFGACSAAIYGFWHFFLVPAGLKELLGYQVFGILIVGRYLIGTIKIVLRIDADKGGDPDIKRATWQLAEFGRLLFHAVLLVIGYWIFHFLERT